MYVGPSMINFHIPFTLGKCPRLRCLRLRTGPTFLPCYHHPPAPPCRLPQGLRHPYPLRRRLNHASTHMGGWANREQPVSARDCLGGCWHLRQPADSRQHHPGEQDTPEEAHDTALRRALQPRQRLAEAVLFRGVCAGQ
jgi:hypothetical protein